MRRSRSVLQFVLSVLLTVCGATAFAAIPDSLTIEWIQSAEAGRIGSTPAFQWLDDGRLVVHTRGTGGAAGSMEVWHVSRGTHSALVDLAAARASLRDILGDAAPAAVPFPVALDGRGRWSVHMFAGDVFLLDHVRAAFTRVTTTAETEKCVTLSPDGNAVAFVRNNDLFTYDISAEREERLTHDGSDSLLNGTLTWVYWEEIFGRNDTGYWWSPDSRSIAYLQTDEAGVSIQHYVDVEPWTPRVIRQRYPKIGQKNPVVRVGVVRPGEGRTQWVDLAQHPHEYVVRVGWLPDSRQLSVQTLNRLQTRRDLLVADASTGRASTLLTEHDSAWVEINDGLTFLKDGRGFVWPSERTGYQHLYLYDMQGKLIRPVTQGRWTIRESAGVAWVRGGVVSVQEGRNEVFFTALERSPLERHLYRSGLDGTGFRRISEEEGTHSVAFSPDGSMYVDRASAVGRTPSLTVHDRTGKRLLVLQEGAAVGSLAAGLRVPEFTSIPARDGFPLPAQILRPARYEPGRRYPVIIYVYGGPSAPSVVNGWQRDIFWENLLLQHGYVVVHVDNRSATGISKDLEKLVLKRMLGEVELNDLVDAARWLKAQPFVDPERVGVWGWSGGGSNTILGMTRSKEFRAGIAVAGVTDFRFYDTRFAEQYMRTEKENARGFEEYSLLRYAKDLHGRLLLVHGTYDDNVHIANTWAFVNELITANRMFEMMLYPMRMHGISDRAARVHLYTTMLAFWKRNL